MNNRNDKSIPLLTNNESNITGLTTEFNTDTEAIKFDARTKTNYHAADLSVKRKITMMKQIEAIVCKDVILWRRDSFNFVVMFILAFILGKFSG